MKITPEIREAIRLAVIDMGSQAALANVIGVSETNVGRYLNGGVKKISIKTWSKLEKCIKKYLPKDFGQSVSIGGENSGQVIQNTTGKINLRHKPVISPDEYKSKLISKIIELELDDAALGKVIRAVNEVIK